MVKSIVNSPEVRPPRVEILRSRRSSSQFLRPQVTDVTPVVYVSSDKVPLFHLKRKITVTREYSSRTNFQTFAIGSRVSALAIVPFNQASKQNVDALVDYRQCISTTPSLSLLFPKMIYIIPFTGIPENDH